MYTRTVALGLLILAAGCTFDADGKKRLWPASIVSRHRPEARPAPPTQGLDADGKMVNVSDHLGKVVLLSFWHSQCPPCRALFAHEKKLVTKHSPALFALIGVNADPDPDRLRKTQQAEKLSYPSIADGANGPLCAAWGVEGFPTLVLLDPAGKVRWRQVGAPEPGEIDAQIRRLIEEPQLTSR
jgi:thiol-disulfide isomerase/thioredoxin